MRSHLLSSAAIECLWDDGDGGHGQNPLRRPLLWGGELVRGQRIAHSYYDSAQFTWALRGSLAFLRHLHYGICHGVDAGSPRIYA